MSKTIIRIIDIIHGTLIYIIHYLAKLPLYLLMRFKLNVRFKNIGELYRTRGPLFLLPNHASQWDPFILIFASLKPIHWVASDGAFRDSMLKPFMLFAGTIPKIKEQSDMAILQKIQRTVWMRHIMGIFPEGAQNWDGESIELIPSTAKLVRFLKIPVVVPILKGNYLTKPRWAWQVRRCRIDVHFKRIIDAKEIKTMKLSEIQQRLEQAIIQDDYAWQKEAKVPIAGEQRAETLELVYYICPQCREIGTMRSSGNDLSCGCGYTVHIDRYGFFEYPPNGPCFESPKKWRIWQDNLLETRIKETLERTQNGSEDPILLQDHNVTLKWARRAMPMHEILTGQARLYRDRIEVGDKSNQLEVFPLKDVSAICTFKQQKFEFRYDKIQYRFAMPSRSISGYKWEFACKAVLRLI